MKVEDIIPEDAQAFAREFTELAQKHRLSNAHVNFRFDNFLIERRWPETIDLVWEQGRHGEDAKIFRLETTLRLRGNLSSGKEHTDD